MSLQLCCGEHKNGDLIVEHDSDFNPTGFLIAGTNLVIRRQAFMPVPNCIDARKFKKYIVDGCLCYQKMSEDLAELCASQILLMFGFLCIAAAALFIKYGLWMFTLVWVLIVEDIPSTIRCAAFLGFSGYLVLEPNFWVSMSLYICYGMIIYKCSRKLVHMCRLLAVVSRR